MQIPRETSLRVGFVCGAFDLLHPGHVILLNQARMRCDQLIVGLHTDPSIERPGKNKPIQSSFERWLQLDALECVDHIIPYDTESDLIALLSSFQISVRFLGEDYRGLPITGDDICEELGIQLVFLNRRHTYSSSELRKRIHDKESGIS